MEQLGFKNCFHKNLDHSLFVRCLGDYLSNVKLRFFGIVQSELSFGTYERNKTKGFFKITHPLDSFVSNVLMYSILLDGVQTTKGFFIIIAST